MICIESIELGNVKNVEHGRIEFKENPFGSRITGIYGQNGSGKTAVVDALACVRDLLRGGSLGDSSTDLVGASSVRASVKVEFGISSGSSRSLGLMDSLVARVADGKPFTVGYSFSFESREGAPHVVSEALYVRAEGMMQRTLLAYDLSEPSQGRSFLPEARWRSLRALAGPDAALDLAIAQRSDELKASSRVFSRALLTFALAARKSYQSQSQEGKLSNSARVAYESTLRPLMDSVSLLKFFVVEKLEVFDTTRGAALAFNVFSLSAPMSARGSWLDVSADDAAKESFLVDVSLPIDETTVIPLDVYSNLSHAVEVENQVLRTIVPGLSVEVHALNKETMDDGVPGVRVEVLSRRGEVRVPFRAESEGVKKIVSLLGRLIDVYNDDSACIVIDEMDSGVFEFLLGELLEVLVERGRGQLIFTAHNLRPLECLPVGCLVFTTVNPRVRYIRFKGSAPSNNLRNQYLRSLNLGGQREQVYEPTNALDISSAFFRAGNADNMDFDELLAKVAGEHE